MELGPVEAAYSWHFSVSVCDIKKGEIGPGDKATNHDVTVQCIFQDFAQEGANAYL